MIGLPHDSPWGGVQHCEKLIEGVYLVSTASHGGVMVRKNAADFLSSDARKVAFGDGNYLCFEEDCDEAVVIRELLDKKLWELPDRIADKAVYEENINRSIQNWNPEYWAARNKTRAAQTSCGEETELEMRDVRKDIIFRDSDYKEKFRIKDGENIKITVAYDGEELIRKCRYLDEAHLNVGSTCYHVDEFMEKMSRVGNTYEPIPGQLPELEVVIAEPGKPPREAVIPMNRLSLHELVGGEALIEIKERAAYVRGRDGNGVMVVCGISGGELTSLHPYEAQTIRRQLTEKPPVTDTAKPVALSERLEAGKVKAAAHIPVRDDHILAQRQVEWR